MASVLLFDTVQTINKDLIKESDLKKLINKDNSDFPKKLDSYTIHHKELSDLLKDYKYSAANEIEFYTGAFKDSNKKKNSRRRRTTRRRKQTRSN
jgi:hypothetical protein